MSERAPHWTAGPLGPWMAATASAAYGVYLSAELPGDEAGKLAEDLALLVGERLRGGDLSVERIADTAAQAIVEQAAAVGMARDFTAQQVAALAETHQDAIGRAFQAVLQMQIAEALKHSGGEVH